MLDHFLYYQFLHTTETCIVSKETNHLNVSLRVQNIGTSPDDNTVLYCPTTRWKDLIIGALLHILHRRVS
jgi:hypothetical protein